MKGLILKSLLNICFIAMFASVSFGQIIISEYIEGSSYNKAIELYNGGDATVNLDSYTLKIYFNGNTTANGNIALSGTVNPGETYVIVHSSFDTGYTGPANLVSGSLNFNGDDAVTLEDGTDVVDSFGQIGVDPGSQWVSGDVTTQNQTLRRKTEITAGDADGTDTFDPAQEWSAFDNDTFDGLGTHDSGNQMISVIINEIDADTDGTDTLEFIELYDGGTGHTDLSGLTLVLFNGSSDTSYYKVSLEGLQTSAAGYFVIGNAAVATVDHVIPDNKIQNGADAVALYQKDASEFPTGSPVSTENLLDAIVYDTDDADDAGLIALLNTAQPQVNERDGGDGTGHSSQRCGEGTARNTDGYRQDYPTPGNENFCPIISQCFEPATKIHAIQGAGESSPLEGETVTIEGIVVGDFQGSGAYSGFYVQEEDSEIDGDQATSEGIFVYDGTFGVDVNPGDVVRINGKAAEYYGMTQLDNVAQVEVCSTGNQVTSEIITLPLQSLESLEAFEGMQIEVLDTLTVSENYNLGRYGQLLLSKGRLFNPTNVVAPGAEAIAYKAQNALNQLLLDDGSKAQNPESIIFPAPGLTAENTVRSGYEVSNLKGVLDYRYSNFALQATEAPVFTETNARTETPEVTQRGNLRVASFNVLNFFNGDGMGGGFPTSRGADSIEEFDRQKEKIISALVALDADIVGLMEIENDGYGPNSAIAQLVNELNLVSNGTYAFVDPGLIQLGTDEIAVGFIYRTDAVKEVGTAQTISEAPFDDKNRQPLAQSFELLESGEKLTVVVNHFKSKGSSCDTLGDPDLADGQGNCNLTRVAASQALVTWITDSFTGSVVKDYLIIGDLNAYAKEDPITTLTTAGYTNLIEANVADGYSYVYQGEAGYLDHALGNASLSDKVIGVTEWHINADEPKVLDYNVEYKSTDQVTDLYSTDQFRSSDHDPVIIDLQLDYVMNLDFNADGKVNFRDFRKLIRNLRKPVTPERQKYDLNRDGKINIIDLFIFIISYHNR